MLKAKTFYIILSSVVLLGKIHAGEMLQNASDDESLLSHASSGDYANQFLPESVKGSTPESETLDFVSAVITIQNRISTGIQQRTAEPRTPGGYRDTVINQLNHFGQVIIRRQTILLQCSEPKKDHHLPLLNHYLTLSETIDRILNQPERSLFSKYSARQKAEINSNARAILLLVSSLEKLLADAQNLDLPDR